MTARRRWTAMPNQWPDGRAKWLKPEDWSTPGSQERIDLIDPGPLMPGDFVELADGRVMQVVLRTARGALGLVDA